MRVINITLIKYLFFGVVNSVIGYGVFFVLLNVCHLRAEYANACGYGVALMAAFTFNKFIVFHQAKHSRGALLRFFMAFVFAFSINQWVLIFFHHTVGVRADIAQIFAMMSYTVVFYLLNRHFVFCERMIREF